MMVMMKRVFFLFFSSLLLTLLLPHPRCHLLRANETISAQVHQKNQHLQSYHVVHVGQSTASTSLSHQALEI